jgi:hypothetical protein
LFERVLDVFRTRERKLWKSINEFGLSKMNYIYRGKKNRSKENYIYR